MTLTGTWRKSRMPPKLCISLPTSREMLHPSCIDSENIRSSSTSTSTTSYFASSKASTHHPPLYIKLHLHSATGVHGMMVHLRTGHQHHNRTPNRNAHNRSNTNTRTIFTYELWTLFFVLKVQQWNGSNPKRVIQFDGDNSCQAAKRVNICTNAINTFELCRKYI
jgi:hypothetical protein